MDELERDKRIKAEVARLRKIYKDVPPDRMALYQGLIVQAARLRISLDDLWEDISTNGNTEPFQQSVNTEPYDRERPAARLFNSRDTNYQKIIKMLNDRLPETPPADPAAELQNFLAGNDAD